MDYSAYMKMYKKVDMYSQIRNNKIKSVLLITIMFFLIIAIIYVFGLVYNPATAFVFLIFGIIFSTIYILVMFYKSDKIALASVKAYEAKDKKFNHLNNLVEGLALAGGLPKPKVYVMPSKEINAFASGRNPENAVVCVTEGCLEQLTNKELEGVIAHELTHIRNYDIRFVTLAVVLVGIIAIIAEIFLRGLWFSGNNENRSPWILIIGVLVAILAPIIATLVQLSISRKREFMADAGAIQLTKDTSGLINALKKIDAYYSKNNKTIANKTVSNMFLAAAGKKSISNLFATHPPIELRINILERM